MKSTLLSLILICSFLTPQVHAQTVNPNAELIQKLLAQIVLLQAELNKLIAAKGGSTSTTPCTFTRTLREGTQGQDVTCLQTYLKKKGHFSGTATGFYGPLTKDAVYKWQKSVGIVPEPTAIGMFGPRSQETLVREMRATPSVATTNTNTPSPTNTTKPTKGGGGGGGGGTPTRTDTATRPLNDRTNPTLPTNLTAVANSSSQITLTWTASTDAGGLKGYNIYKVGTAAPLNATPQTGTTFTHTGLTANTAYTYQIEAIDNAGNKSAKTASVSKTTLAPLATPDTTKPTTPGQPTASLVTQTTLRNLPGLLLLTPEDQTSPDTKYSETVPR
jgi:chitodextrinase